VHFDKALTHLTCLRGITSIGVELLGSGIHRPLARKGILNELLLKQQPEGEPLPP
jgi:hypothetical protein